MLNPMPEQLQVAVARQSSDWRAILEQDGWDARVHLVNRFDLKLIIDTSSLPSDTTITRTKVGVSRVSLACNKNSSATETLVIRDRGLNIKASMKTQMLVWKQLYST